MKRSKFLIVGVGAIGRELLHKLSREYDISCIDVDPATPEIVKEIRGEDVRVIVGDATSRLVLEDSGVDEADAVLLTAATERVNLEVARLLADHFAVPRVISVGITPSGTRELADLGVEVENLFSQSASALRNRIEQRAKAAHGIGLERGEILEVEVHPNSRLVGKTLSELAPVRWRIGIVYRDGNIVLPSGDTALRPRDRVIVIGEPDVLQTVCEMLTFRFAQFPLEYGSTLTGYLTGDEGAAFFAEFQYLISALPLEKAVLIYAKKARRRRAELSRLWQDEPPSNLEERETDDSLLEALGKTVEDPVSRPGIIVLSKPALLGSALRFTLDLRGKNLLHRLSRATQRPILLAGGSFPYDRLAVPCIHGVDVHHVLEAVFEMGTFLQHETTGLLVEPSEYLSADEDLDEFQQMRKTLTDMSLIYRTSAKIAVLTGNPVEAVSQALPRYNLAVVDAGGWTEAGWIAAALNPDAVWHIIRRTATSTLLLPSAEETL